MRCKTLGQGGKRADDWEGECRLACLGERGLRPRTNRGKDESQGLRSELYSPE